MPIDPISTSVSVADGIVEAGAAAMEAIEVKELGPLATMTVPLTQELAEEFEAFLHERLPYWAEQTEGWAEREFKHFVDFIEAKF